MGHIASWIAGATWKPGLDNLGTQQPCEFIYSALLPGITNVTERAWLFGFYPWFIWAFEKRHPDASDTEFRESLRRADCLATLVAARHEIVCGDKHDGDPRNHGSALPGRLKLIPAARSLSEGSTLRLSDFADRSEENPLRYFKNRLGGLGQYYLGVLRDEYGVLFGDGRSGVRYVKDVALPLITAFNDGLDDKLFLDAVDGDHVTSDLLDQLSPFCPCALHERRETARTYLADMFLGRISPSTPTQIKRRLSLGLALDFLAGANGAESDDETIGFLCACYSGTLPTQRSWELPPPFGEVRAQWALYLRNEMLSLAWQAVFKATLEKLDGVRGIADIRSAAVWCVEQPEFEAAIAKFGHASFDEAVKAELRSLPQLTEEQHPQHELALWRKLLASEAAELLAAAMRMLAVLIARHGETADHYAPLRLSKTVLVDYPLTLNTLGESAKGPWRGPSTEHWLRMLIATALSTHQRVAIRKWGQSHDDTLMFRIGENGLFVERLPERLAQTQPRLGQAFQILRDLGLTLVKTSDHLPALSASGQAALDDIRHG